MIRYFYFATRNSSLTPSSFRSRWRRHAAITTSRPSWKNMLLYVQADALDPCPLSGSPPPFDGFVIGEIGDNFSVGPEEDEVWQALMQDEREIFSGPITPRLMYMRPTILREGAYGLLSVCLAFHDMDDGRSVAEFYASRDDIERVVCNAVEGDSASGSAATYRAIVEVAAMDWANIKAAFDGDPGDGWRKAEVVVTAKENLLWGGGKFGGDPR